MITPRPYLSWSSMDLFERSPEKWTEVYLYGRKLPINRGMALGKAMAEGLEKNTMTGDIVLDLAMAKLPKFEIMDKEFMADLPDGKRVIKILAKPDSMSVHCSVCGRVAKGMEEFDYEKPERTIRERSSGAGKMAESQADAFMAAGKTPFNKQGTKALVRGHQGVGEAEFRKLEKGYGPVEQGQKVFGRNSKKNEHREDRSSASDVYRNKEKNRSGELEGQDAGIQKIEAADGVHGMAKKSVQKGRLDMPRLWAERGTVGSASHQAVRALSKTSVKDQQWPNAVQAMPQENTQTCRKCKNEPHVKILEYKTGQSAWTKKQVDESGQLTFYATAIYLKTGRIP